MVDVICSVTRSTSGCDVCVRVPKSGRGKRLVGDTDLAGCDSPAVVVLMEEVGS